jgi:hypothetical protein
LARIAEYVERLVTDGFRRQLEQENASSAVHNRRINVIRQRGRSIALISLVLAVTVALMASSAICVNQRLLQGTSCHGIAEPKDPGALRQNPQLPGG